MDVRHFIMDTSNLISIIHNKYVNRSIHHDIHDWSKDFHNFHFSVSDENGRNAKSE